MKEGTPLFPLNELKCLFLDRMWQRASTATGPRVRVTSGPGREANTMLPHCHTTVVTLHVADTALCGVVGHKACSIMHKESSGQMCCSG